MNRHHYEVIKLLINKHKKVASTSNNVSILKLNISTHNNYKKLNKKYGQRQIRGTFTVTLIDTNGNIENMNRYLINYGDTLRNSELKDITTDWEVTHFSNISPRRTVWHRVIQPGLLLVSLGVTIYLLFNVRGH